MTYMNMERIMFGLWGIFVLGIFALLGFSVIQYSSLFRKFVPRLVYYIVAIALNVITIYSMFGLSMDDDSVFFLIISFVTTVIFVIGAYSSLLFLIKYILLLFTKLFRKSSSGFAEVLKGNIYKAAALLLTVAMGIAGYINMSIIEVNEYTFESDKLDEGAQYSFAVITDAHLGTGLRSGSIHQMVEMINDADVDAVLFVGDMADNRTPANALEVLREELPGIEATYGCFYSDGNHDGSAIEDISELMKSSGVTVLEGNSVSLCDDILLYGVKDSGFRMFENAITTEQLPSDTYNIVMSHIPVGLASYSDNGADLSVSGHTHGEQFPLMYPIIASANDVVEGQARIDDMDVFVSSGIGGWGVHFSLPSRKEIAIIKVIGVE